MTLLAALTSQSRTRVARDAAELAQCVKRLQRRAVEQLLTVRAMRATLRRLEASEAAPLAFAWREAA